MSSRVRLTLHNAAVCLVLISLLAACGGGGSSGSSAGDNTGGGTATGFYEPFSSFAGGGVDAGIWLVSAEQSTATPIQVTAANVDLPQGAGATFFDWTYDSSSRKRNTLAPSFFAYGSGGHLYGVSLRHPGAPAQLSSGTYGTLCSLQPVQAGPFSGAVSYVLAQVSSSSSAPVCDTTWIIPTGADAGTAPSTTPSLVTFLGGLKNPENGLATGFLMSTGTELDVYSSADMTKTATLIGSLPSGARVSLLGISAYMGSVQGVVVETGTRGTTTLQDDVFLASSSRVQHVGTYSLPTFTTCGSSGQGAFVTGTAIDSTLLYAVSDPSGGAGFKVYSVPLGGGTPAAIYSDTTDCAPFVDAADAGRLILDVFDTGASQDKTLSVSATGPSGQTPPILTTSGVSNFGFVNYSIDGRGWVQDFILDPVSGNVTDVSSSIVDLANGHKLKTYSHSMIVGDFWDGFNADGSVDRGPIFVATGNTTANCKLVMAGIDSIDSTTLASTSIPVAGSPCESQIFGPAPLALTSFSGSMYFISRGTNGSFSFGKAQVTSPGGNKLGEVFGSLVY